jgi:hypothetical protein
VEALSGALIVELIVLILLKRPKKAKSIEMDSPFQEPTYIVKIGILPRSSRNNLAIEPRDKISRDKIKILVI